jgi:aryl-alcohol dehydrogenase-like predicted oxidoreductase
VKPPRTVSLGGTEVSRIGLGTNRLSYTPGHVAFIRAAVESGIDVVDTAHLYVGGDSERTVGAALGNRNWPTLVAATKGGYASGEGRPEILREQIEQSLASLQTDSIDLYYLHRVHADTPLEDSLGVIKEYRDAGRIKRVGLSQVSVGQIEQARAIVQIDAVQSHYNLAERHWDDVVDYCTREGIVFVPYFPLRADHPAQAEIAEEHGATPQQIALAWLLHRSPLMLPIPGTLSLNHARENIAALDVELSDEELAALADL